MLCLLFIASPLKAELPEFTSMAKEVGSAVVNISTIKVIEGSQDMQRFLHPFQKKGSPFEEFFDQFERFFGDRLPQQERKQRSLGSGFIISEDGYIVTNNHVIKDADEIQVNLKKGEKSYKAQVVGRDDETDLALLKVDVDQELPVLEFGDSEELQIGQWVLAIGNPFGLEHTVTAGIVSAKGRVIGAGPYDDFIQTDASINPGNSGGPLLNMQGKVVGINTAIVASGQGIGFAIPSTIAEDVITQLKKYKKVKRGWLGVGIQNMDEKSAQALGLEKPKGALVNSVEPGDPAAKAGIKPGDVIIAVDGEKIEGARDLTKIIGNTRPGERVQITLWRDEKVKEVRVKLGERDVQQTASREEAEPETTGASLGLELRPVKEQEAQSLGLEKTRGLLVVGVMSGSAAEESGLQAGDVILEANQQPVDSLDDFQEVMQGSAKEKGLIMLLLKRRGHNLFRTIPLENN
jgi:serine protease Do